MNEYLYFFSLFLIGMHLFFFFLHHLYLVGVSLSLCCFYFSVSFDPFLVSFLVYQFLFVCIRFNLSFFSFGQNSSILLTFRCICFNQIENSFYILKMIRLKTLYFWWMRFFCFAWFLFLFLFPFCNGHRTHWSALNV